MRAMLVLALGLAAVGASADETSVQAFRFPEGITISVPQDWTVYDEAKIRQYREGIVALSEKSRMPLHVPISETRTLFRAEKPGDGAMTRATMTVGPAELTQQEIENWPQEKIDLLGRHLGERRRRAMESIGMEDVVVSPAHREKIGGKTAVYMTMSVKDKANNVRIGGRSYFIYLDRMTLIFSLETIHRRPDATGANTDAIVSSLVIE